MSQKYITLHYIKGLQCVVQEYLINHQVIDRLITFTIFSVTSGAERSEENWYPFYENTMNELVSLL